MKKLIALVFFLGFIFVACQTEESDEQKIIELKELIKQRSKTGELDYYVFPDSDDYANLPNQDPANPVTEAKVKLGNMLFFETGLAQSPNNEECYETYSCSSCHIPSRGLLPGRIQGIADGAFGYGEHGETRELAPSYAEDEIDAQGTRPMNPLNAGYSTVTLWSGAFGAGGPNEGTEEYWTGLSEVNHTGYLGLEAQNIEAFALHRLDINEKVLDEYGYRQLYDEAFPDFPVEERYSPTTSSFAIGAFLRSFLANKAPFQEFLKGDDSALTHNQIEGAMIFFDKGRCYSCHRETALSAMDFHAIGTPDMYQNGGLNTGPDDPRNLGRGMFTGQEQDMRKFKVPQLYNLKDYSMYFHGSSKTSLEDVVDYKINAQSENPNIQTEDLSGYFKPIELTKEDRLDLLDFLRDALYDSDYERYVPDAIPSGNCFPNNDPVAQRDLNCM